MMGEDLKDLLRAFNAHAVKYLVVGGYAFGVHAEPRATKNLDLFIQPTQENSDAVFRALAQFGAPWKGWGRQISWMARSSRSVNLLRGLTSCSKSTASASMKHG